LFMWKGSSDLHTCPGFIIVLSLLPRNSVPHTCHVAPSSPHGPVMQVWWYVRCMDSTSSENNIPTKPLGAKKTICTYIVYLLCTLRWKYSETGGSMVYRLLHSVVCMFIVYWTSSCTLLLSFAEDS
jgi:hypothetical protein